VKLFLRPAFRPAFQVAATNVGPSVVLIHNEKLDNPNQPPGGGHRAEGMCFGGEGGGPGSVVPNHSLNRPAGSK
jgi:hypothetical protein